MASKKLTVYYLDRELEPEVFSINDPNYMSYSRWEYKLDAQAGVLRVWQGDTLHEIPLTSISKWTVQK